MGYHHDHACNTSHFLAPNPQSQMKFEGYHIGNLFVFCYTKTQGLHPLCPFCLGSVLKALLIVVTGCTVLRKAAFCGQAGCCHRKQEGLNRSNHMYDA